MIVRVSYTVNANDDFRRAIRSYYGLEGLATREEVRDWFRSHGESMNDDVMYELELKEQAAA